MRISDWSSDVCSSDLFNWMPGTVYTKASKQVAQALADARKQAGLLQEELARRVGKDQSFVSNIERGQRRIDVLELSAMARAMDRDPSDLYRTLVAELPNDIEVLDAQTEIR